MEALTFLNIVGILLTLVGSIIGARGGMLNRVQIDERVDSQGRWHDEAPEWVRSDYEANSRSLRIGLWFIAAGTMLQLLAAGAALLV